MGWEQSPARAATSSRGTRQASHCDPRSGSFLRQRTRLHGRAAAEITRDKTVGTRRLAVALQLAVLHTHAAAKAAVHKTVAAGLAMLFKRNLFHVNAAPAVGAAPKPVGARGLMLRQWVHEALCCDSTPALTVEPQPSDKSTPAFMKARRQRQFRTWSRYSGQLKLRPQKWGHGARASLSYTGSRHS